MTTLSRPLGALFLVITLSIPSIATAFEVRTGDGATHPKNETLTDDLYLLGGSITSSGIIKGDIATFGGNILINGAVSGDVAAGGGNITVLSDIGDDIRLGGGTVVIQGAVGGDVLAAGGQVTLSSPRIGGDVTIGAGAVHIDAPIVGDLTIGGGDVRINSAVTGNVDIQAESITLGPKARINGTFTYKSPKEATVESGAVVVGETAYTKSPDVREAAKLGLLAFFSIWFVAKMFMVFSGALVLGYVFQRFSDEFVVRATKSTLAEFGRGVIFFIVLPIVSVLLLFTVIGIAFGVLGLLGFTAVLIVGTMLAPILIGSVVHKIIFKQHEYEVSWKTILTGTILYFIIAAIPVLGPLIAFAITLIAIGAMLAIKAKVLGEWR